MEEALKLIEKEVKGKKYVVAAISGGPDSMMLLLLLLQLSQKFNFNIVVAHVHHNLRKESDEEALNLEKFCRDNNLIFEMTKLTYPNGKFSEAEARKLRYDYFDSIVKKYNTDILFTAHHGDDLIETILMRITRGSSLKGYAGFSLISIDRGYKIARPLIYLTKDEILSQLNKKNIWYAKDMSNESDTYTRNRYRKYILPILKEENPKVNYKYSEFSNKLMLAHSYIEKQSNKYYSNVVSDNKIDVKQFNNLDLIIKQYILEQYLSNIYMNNVDLLTSTHLNILISFLSKNKNGYINLPNNMIGVLEYGEFYITTLKQYQTYDYIFNDKVILPDGKIISIDNTTELTSNFVIHLNSKEITFPLHVRTIKPGDTMNVKNMLGKKKVSHIFIDSKIPKGKRKTYPIVTDNTGKIIWIPGIKKSDLDRKKDKKYDIILKYS